MPSPSRKITYLAFALRGLRLGGDLARSVAALIRDRHADAGRRRQHRAEHGAEQQFPSPHENPPDPRPFAGSPPAHLHRARRARDWVIGSWRSGDETVKRAARAAVSTQRSPSRGWNCHPVAAHASTGGRAPSSPHAQRRRHRPGHEPAARARRHLAGGLRARRDARPPRSAPGAAGRRRGRRRGRALHAHAPGTPAPGRGLGVPRRASRATGRGALAGINRALGSLERAEPGLAGAASAIGLDGRERARVVRGEAAPVRGARARRPRPAVLPRDARDEARRRPRLAALPLGRHRPVGRLELGARARRPRRAARDRALRARARERAGDRRGRARPRARRPDRRRRPRERAQDPRHLARRARRRRRRRNPPIASSRPPGSTRARCRRAASGSPIAR